jgi:D-alanyl-D-alanine carboxypeptidase
VTVDETRLRSVIEQFVDRPDTGAVSVALAIPSDGWSYSYESAKDPKPFFAASVTKLYTAAIIMQLREEGALTLESPLRDFFDTDLLAGLHSYWGIDSSESITVRQLLSHTSGLPSYLRGKRRDGGTVIEDALAHDVGWTFEQMLTVVRNHMNPVVLPGRGWRAHYSETNYAILGGIIEAVTGGTWERAVSERVLGPLHLSGTWPFTIDDVERYDEIAKVLRDGKPIRIPLTMASVKAQGGLVSTAEDGILFLRAFLGGHLFDAAYVPEMMAVWRRSSRLIYCGLGITRLRLSALEAGGGPREFIGHAAPPGAFLYFAPESGLYVSGTLNRHSEDKLVRQFVGLLGSATTTGE